MRWTLSLFLFLPVLLVLSACETGYLPSSGSSGTSQAKNSIPTASKMAKPRPTPPTEKSSEPGGIAVIIKPSSVGDYYGWHLQIPSAKSNQSFKPIYTDMVQAGYTYRINLWPDQYRLRVMLRNNAELDQWITVKAGEMRVVLVDVGFVFNDITVVPLDDPRNVNAMMIHGNENISVTDAFNPVNIPITGEQVAVYYGPRDNDMPYGKGPATIREGGIDIAESPEVTIENGKPTGDVVFKDGRIVEPAPGKYMQIPEGARTEWPDGRRFSGQYDGLAPEKGTMSFTNGIEWNGMIGRNWPAGEGQVTYPDGTIIDNVAGIDSKQYHGVYPCRKPGQDAGNCYFINGQQIASEAEYIARMEQVKRDAEIAATQAAAKKAASEAQATAPASSPSGSSSPTVDGCTYVEGKFTTSSGLSKLTLDGRGRGHLWQQTYGGSTTYTMDIDFTYSGSRNSMSFNYQPAQYRDASGTLLRTIPVPGTTTQCSYDGKELNVNGTVYFKN